MRPELAATETASKTSYLGKLEYIVGNLMIDPAQKTQNFFGVG